MIHLVEQVLNGVQFGIMLFLMAAGLTLIFGIMNVINLAHGSLYMVGAYVAAATFAATGSFLVGLAAALVAAVLVGIAVEVAVFRREPGSRGRRGCQWKRLRGPRLVAPTGKRIVRLNRPLLHARDRLPGHA